MLQRAGRRRPAGRRRLGRAGEGEQHPLKLPRLAGELVREHGGTIAAGLGQLLLVPATGSIGALGQQHRGQSTEIYSAWPPYMWPLGFKIRPRIG